MLLHMDLFTSFEKMRQLVLKNLRLFLLLTCTFPIQSFSQSLTGIWRGFFIGNLGEQYRLEFQVKQAPNGKVFVSGVSYSWQDDIRFYGKATMTGSFIPASQNFLIHEIKTVEVRNPGGGSTCIMKYDLQYSRSGKEEYLEGTYLGKQETKDTSLHYEWGDCGGGKVFLRRVNNTDFYVEPFLRNVVPQTKSPVNTPPPVVKKEETVTPPPPALKKPVAQNKTQKTTTPGTNTTKPVVIPPKKNIVAPNADSMLAKPNDVKKQAQVKIPVVTPSVLKTRQNELMKSLVVNDPDVTVKLYDNGEIDDDTISVYLDKMLVLSNKRLTASPLTLKLKMDEENPDHELVMVAENLGRIPPNTSLMVVTAGEQRFEVRITSTDQKNAVVKFRYEKP